MAIHFESFTLEWTLVEEKRLVPAPTAAGVLSHYDFVTKTVQSFAACCGRSQVQATELNHSARPHLVNYDCGTTLDATPLRDDTGGWGAPPFDRKLRQGVPQDRNSKHTGRVWHEADPKQTDLIDEICSTFAEACDF